MNKKTSFLKLNDCFSSKSVQQCQRTNNLNFISAMEFLMFYLFIFFAQSDVLTLCFIIKF